MFELEPGLVDELIYGMENQDGLFVLDTQTMQVLPDDEVEPEAADEEGRIVPLPEWRPVDGFRLMEGFAASLRNPLFREELRVILQSGRGVFRQFKDAVRQRPDMERLWFSWKQREMRRRIHEWYNNLREVWGLAPLAWEDNPEQDTADLVLWDFEFRELRPEECADFARLDRQFFDEAYAGLAGPELDRLYARLRRGQPLPPAEGGGQVTGVFAPGGELVGFMWCCLGPDWAELMLIGVWPEYRGLGMARTLIQTFLRLARAEAGRRGGDYPVWCTVPRNAAFLERHLGLGAGAGQLTVLRGVASPA